MLVLLCELAFVVSLACENQEDRFRTGGHDQDHDPDPDHVQVYDNDHSSGHDNDHGHEHDYLHR